MLYLFEIVAEQDRDIVQCRKLLAERSIEHGSQSEDKQADCLSKNATFKFIPCIFASFGLPELNCHASCECSDCFRHCTISPRLPEKRYCNFRQ